MISGATFMSAMMGSAMVSRSIKRQTEVLKQEFTELRSEQMLSRRAIIAAYEDAAKFAFTGMKRKKITKELMSHYGMILNKIVNNQYSEEAFCFCSTCYEKNKRTNKFCAKCGEQLIFQNKTKENK